MVFTRPLARLHKVRPFGFGAVAQLIERFVRNEEVVGLIPICSTKGLRGKTSASKGAMANHRQPPPRFGKHAAADGAIVDVHLADRDGNGGGQAELPGPTVTQVAGRRGSGRSRPHHPRHSRGLAFITCRNCRLKK